MIAHLVEENWLERTNNRIESLNQKIKYFMDLKKTMKGFVSSMLNLHEVLESERNISALQMFEKEPHWALEDSCMYYWHHLTFYVFNYVAEQMEKIVNYETVVNIEKGIYQVNSKVTGDFKYTTTATSCTCKDFNSMQLPCRHIFKIKAILEEDFFYASQCARRWEKDYYVQNSPEFKNCSQHKVDYTNAHEKKDDLIIDDSENDAELVINNITSGTIIPESESETELVSAFPQKVIADKNIVNIEPDKEWNVKFPNSESKLR